MLRITIFIVNVLAFLALSAQDGSTAPPVEAPDSLVFRLNGNELYGTLMRPTVGLMVSWYEAGEAEFAVILDLDDTGKVSRVESIAFGGCRHLPLLQFALSNVTLDCSWLSPMTMNLGRNTYFP